MAKCIVCRSDYAPGSPCPRCGADNRPWEQWEAWQREHWGIGGWVDFLARGLYLPAFLTALTFPIGIVLLRSFWLTKQLAWSWAIPGLGILTLVCLFIVVITYESRNRIRERELLRQVRHGPSRALGVQSQILAIPLIVIVAISAWTALILSLPAPVDTEQNCLEYLLSTVQSQGPFSAATWRACIDVVTLGGPLSIAVLSFASLLPALVYSSSLGLALLYAGRMNQRVPMPIFLNTARMARLVRAEAEQECSNLGPGLIWEGMERTDDGGIKLTARYRHDRKVLEDLAGKKTDLPLHTKCEVLADRWGRIRSIKPESELQM